MAPGNAAWAEAPRSLRELVTRWLRGPHLQAVLRERAQLGPLAVEVGLPLPLRSAAAERLRTGPRTAIELATTSGTHACTILLGNDLAAALTERILGGVGQLGTASRAGALSDAECGVLAYFAACCAATFPTPVRLLDVRSATYAGEENQSEGLLWPISMRDAQLTFDLLLLLSGAPLAAVETLELVVWDDLDESALTALEVGDLLVSDAWPFTVTTRGLSGLVCARIAHAHSEQLAFVLEGLSLRRTWAPVRTTGGAELVLTTQHFPPEALAELVAGASQHLPTDALDQCTLRVAGQLRATGRLVQHGNLVALEVHAVHTAHST